MTSLRAFSREYRGVATLLIALALAMKALVPAGYMLASQSKVLTVQVCADAQGGHFTKQISLPLTGKSEDSQGKHGSASGICVFSSLAMASHSGADAPLLALALTFILALSFAPIHAPQLLRLHRARPPLRGPPASA